MKRFFASILVTALLTQASLANTTTTQSVTGSSLPFYYDSDGTAFAPLVRIWDGTTKMVVVPLGQAAIGFGIPVTLPVVQVPLDLCTLQKKSFVTISSSLADFQLVAPVSLNQIYVCSLMIKSTAIDTISFTEGLTPNCTTGTPTTVVAGMDFAALEKWEQGNGTGTIFGNKTSGYGLCVHQTGTTKIAVIMGYVQSLL